MPERGHCVDLGPQRCQIASFSAGRASIVLDDAGGGGEDSATVSAGRGGGATCGRPLTKPASCVGGQHRPPRRRGWRALWRRAIVRIELLFARREDRARVRVRPGAGAPAPRLRPLRPRPTSRCHRPPAATARGRSRRPRRWGRAGRPRRRGRGRRPRARGRRGRRPRRQVAAGGLTPAAPPAPASMGRTRRPERRNRPALAALAGLGEAGNASGALVGALPGRSLARLGRGHGRGAPAPGGRGGGACAPPGLQAGLQRPRLGRGLRLLRGDVVLSASGATIKRLGVLHTLDKPGIFQSPRRAEAGSAPGARVKAPVIRWRS